MKKIRLIIFACCLSLAGCGAKTTVSTSSDTDAESDKVYESDSESYFDVNEITQDYLRLIGGSDCRIEAYDLNTIQNKNVAFPTIDIFSIVEGIAEDEFCFQVLRSAKEGGVVSENDFIELELEYSETAAGEATKGLFYVVATEEGNSFPDLQKELIGKKVGYRSVLSDSRTDYGPFLPSHDITYTIRRIFDCEIVQGYADTLQYAGVYTVSQFYDYLLKLRIKEKTFLNLFQYRQDCFTSYLEVCTFTWSTDQIEKIAERKAKDYQESAYTLGMSLEDYWNYMRENSIGAPLADDLYVNAVLAAKREVGIVLLIGALAKELELSVSDEEVEKAYNKTADTAFESSMSYIDKVKLGYRVLENKVIAALNPAYAAAFID